MAENTKIQWTSHTFNMWRGCQRVSPGCQHCYAETQSKRNPAVLGRWGPLTVGTRVLADEAQWREPLKWNRAAREAGTRARVFCASIADVFEDWQGPVLDSRGQQLFVNYPLAYRHYSPHRGPASREATLDDVRRDLWGLIRETPLLDWQLLTKRPENIGRMMPPGEWPNVWLGTSVESQEYAWRLDALQEAADRVRCPVRFCSAEPLLEALDIERCLGPAGINWVIVGGESGGGARPFLVDWGRWLVHQCRTKKVPCFVKQLGAHVGGEAIARPEFHDNPRVSVQGHVRLVMADRKGGDPEAWPPDLRVREMPGFPPAGGK